MWPRRKVPVAIAAQMQAEADAESRAEWHAAKARLDAIDAAHEEESRRLAQALVAAVAPMEQAQRALSQAASLCVLAENAVATEKQDWHTNRTRAEAAVRAAADPRLQAMIEQAETRTGYTSTATITRLQELQLLPEASLDATLAKAEAECGAPSGARKFTKELFSWGSPRPAHRG